MKKMFLALIILIIVGICIPAVSADEIYKETFTENTHADGTFTTVTGSSDEPGATYKYLVVSNTVLMRDIVLDSIIFQYRPGHNSIEFAPVPKQADWTRATLGDWGKCDVGYFQYSVAGQTWVQYYMDNFEYTGEYDGASSTLIIPDDPDFAFPRWTEYDKRGDSFSGGPAFKATFGTTGHWPLWLTPNFCNDIKGYTAYHSAWEHDLEITTTDKSDYISIYKHGSESNVLIETNTHTIPSSGTADYEISLYPPSARPYTVNITNPFTSTVFSTDVNIDGSVGESEPSEPSEPTSATTNIYVRNSQTNALLANANLIISASVNGNLHEVVNETAPSGIYSIDLQPTGGGMPNPDFYRLIVTAEGYNSIMPYIDFEVDVATTIYAYLDPTGGAPEDENKTFIDFYVRDLAANGISGATVKFGGYNLITNSAGYTMFEVDKNKKYSWTVSKSGYGSLTGNAVIGADPRHTINTVLAPAVTPTIPTSIPTSTPISPTPTMTAPTGEPVSNWLEWFAAHFGMILGGGAEIGKIFMWLCFAVPVGVYVGKEAKAGAAGFMAGAGIVTLFFVLIGWVPIWLLVLLALIIGLLYAKIINNPDNGGGR